MIFIVALPHALLMKKDDKSLEQEQLQSGMKKCPHCAELVRAEAAVCRFCTREFSVNAQGAPS